MALQVFTAGQTLTAAQMTTLQASTYNYPLSTISSSTYTILSSDAGKLLVFTNNATPVGVTFPASLGMAVGDTVEIVLTGTGTLTLIADAGVTLNSEGSLLTLGTRYGRVSVTKTASNVFLVSWMTAITEAEITAGAVTEGKIGTGAVTEGKIGTGAVTSAKLGSDLDLNGTTEIDEVLETVVNNSSALTGTFQVNARSGSVQYFTAAAQTANWIWNIRADATPTLLNAIMDDYQSITFALFVKNGGTAYYPTSITVDGAAPASLRWFGGTAITAGNVNSVDCYTITVVKTASTVFEVFASQSKFA
jgi:hypothetical protein